MSGLNTIYPGGAFSKTIARILPLQGMPNLSDLLLGYQTRGNASAAVVNQVPGGAPGEIVGAPAYAVDSITMTATDGIETGVPGFSSGSFTFMAVAKLGSASWQLLGNFESSRSAGSDCLFFDDNSGGLISMEVPATTPINAEVAPLASPSDFGFFAGVYDDTGHTVTVYSIATLAGVVTVAKNQQAATRAGAHPETYQVGNGQRFTGASGIFPGDGVTAYVGISNIAFTQAQLSNIYSYLLAALPASIEMA